MIFNEYAPFVFLICFSVFYLAQKLIPLYKSHDHIRIVHNWYLFILTFVILKIFFPFGISKIIETLQMNNNFILDLSNLSLPLQTIILIIVLDISAYFFHRVLHRFDFLWRFHRVHHSDHELDTTTALRFYPAEVVLFSLYKVFIVYLILPNPMAYLIYEYTALAVLFFAHSNLRLASGVDNILRKIIVTPAYHQVHHTDEKINCHKNYGNFLVIWDKIFKTYSHKAQSQKFGIKEYPHKLSIRDIFYMPFK